MLKKAVVFLLALAVLVAALSLFHVFYISDGGNGTLLWNGDTAYLFLNLGSLGYRMTYFQYVGQIAREALGMGREPSDERFSNVIFTISSGNVHRYAIEDMRLGEYFVSNGNIYAGDLNTGILWKWDEGHFERATSQEQVNLTKAAASHMPGPDYDDVDGWHERCCFFTRKNEYSYPLNLNRAALSLTARCERSGDLAVDLVRSDGTKETIWHLAGHSRKARKSEYQHVFAKN